MIQQNINEKKTLSWLFVVNPAAGAGKAGKRWPSIQAALQEANIPFTTVFTNKRFHAGELVAEAVAKGCRQIVAVGGDGTAHEVVNGIFQQPTCPPEDITFTLLPIGTGNDWIKTHRIPRDFKRWLPYFMNGKTGYQDVGWLDYRLNGEQHRRYFINVAGLSYDAFVVKESLKYPSGIPNKLFYLLLIFRCLFKFRIPQARVLFDGQTFENRFYTINIGICRYSGSGIQMVPHALPNDGKLALTLVKKVSKLEVLLVTPLFYLGKIGWHPAVRLFQTMAVKIAPLETQPVLVEADGEFLGESPVEIGLSGNKLKIWMP
ncbi:MAG: diacylglycerol kinase family lipid kinase [Saprospiraceae bacterium]|nr:diacylglycerol kinase family lipid kinase [Saprospiraceae bacterium]